MIKTVLMNGKNEVNGRYLEKKGTEGGSKGQDPQKTEEVPDWDCVE